jgi:hypothetical protein
VPVNEAVEEVEFIENGDDDGVYRGLQLIKQVDSREHLQQSVLFQTNLNLVILSAKHGDALQANKQTVTILVEYIKLLGEFI